MKHSLSHGIVATCRYFALRLLVAAAGVLFFHSAQAVVFDYEPFSTATYNENQQLGKSVGTFTIGNSGGTGSSIVSNAAQLTYSGLLCDTGSRGVARVTNVTTSNRQAGKNITLTSSGSVYCSFLLKVLDAPVSNRCLIVFGSAADQSNPVNAGVFMDSDRKLHASKQNLTTIGDPTPNALDLNTTNLVVFRYTFGSPAAADIWLNPPTDKFGVDEASVPAADVSMTSGGSPTSLGCYSLPQGRGDTSTSTGYGSGSGLLHMDEIRIADNWAEVTPAIGTCTAAGVVSSPINKTATAETTVTFSVNGSGTFPTYQWQLSTNGGTTWNHISSATNSTYTTPTLTLANNGNQYRAIVIVSCSGGSSDTSSVATLTVTAPVITPVGLILDDIWTDGNRTDGPVGISNSVWRASSAGNLVMDGTTMVGSAASGSSRLFVGYFVDDTSSNVPVHLDVGRAIKSTVVFTPINVVAQGGNSIRVGLVDYADGATRVTGDGFGTGSTGNGNGVYGYMLFLNWGTSFNTTTPMEFFARNVNDSALLGTGTSLGQGPIGGVGDTNNAFQSSTEYTLEWTVSRTSASSVDLTAKITGGSLNLSFTTNDSTSAYHRFDAFAFRPNSLETTAESFRFTQFKVEVIPSSAPQPTNPIPVNVQFVGNNVILTWTNPVFNLYSADVVTGQYAIVSGAISPYTNPVSGTQKYFRLKAP